MRTFKTIIVIFLVVFFAFPGIIRADGPDKIAKISVTGNERIDTGFIMNNIKIKENEPYNLDKIQDDMKNIYKTGFFSDVQIDVQDTDKGKAVTFVVIERPPIKNILLSGNKKLKTAEITDKLKIKTNTVLNIEKIKESMDEIRKFYSSKGYYATKVNYEIDYEEGYEASVKFLIDEPEKAYVTKIAFTGNKTFKDSKLKDFMRTKEKGMFYWFTGSGILDEEALDDDRKNIEAFYNDNGYVRVKVGVPDVKISQDGKTMSLTLPVEEGNLYKVGSVDFSGDILFDKEVMNKELISKTDNTFRSTMFQRDVIRLNDFYQDKGYAFCEISPLTLIDDDTQKVNITFDIKKNEEIFINRINVLGNTKTRDKVVRRELRIVEGGRFSATNLKKSQKRLRNTTFFKNADFKIIKTDEPDKVNTDITVEEKPTGTLSAGVGYSTYDKIILSGNISQENFLGTGRKLYLTASLGAVTNNYNFSYLEPYIFDLNMHAGFSVFNFGRILDTYDYNKWGGSLSLIKPLTDDAKGSVRYRYETTSVTNIDATASTYIQDQAGTLSTSSVTFSFGKNTIDDVLNPHIGINTETSFELAGGPFLGDNYFYRMIAFYGKYIPAGFWDSTFFIRGTAGTIQGYGGKEVPVYEKFYVGGMQTVRGFKYGEAGPLDATGEVIGGKNQLFFNLEWVFPIYKPAGFKGVLFFDAGQAFDDSSGWLLNGIRTSAGFGIRWFSPMGPIRLELGFNLNPRQDEKGSVFDFAMGTQY
ncbi:MAG: outer membrane protein assembly factor BamA [Bacteroidota bacterium]